LNSGNAQVIAIEFFTKLLIRRLKNSILPCGNCHGILAKKEIATISLTIVK